MSETMENRIKSILFLPPIFLLFGLGALYIGERALSGIARTIVSGLGILVVVAIVLSLLRVKTSDGERKKAAIRITLEYGICLVAVILYFLQLDALGVIPSGKPQTLVRVVWPALLALGLIPAVAMELALFSMARTPRLELWRIRFAGRAARVIALAIIGFAGLNYAATRWNRKVDLSYFKTTRPGSSTVAMIETITKPLEVTLFFPPGSDVLEQARDYFESLTAKSDLATVAIVDQALDPELARKLRVRANGFLALTHDEKTETIRLGMDLEDARSTLRELDSKVQEKLFKVLRPPRVAYFTTGHLERDFVPPADDPRLGLRDFRTVLEMLGFKTKRLGLGEGLGSEVPEDASLVIIAGPVEPFLAEERAALSKYINRGGRLFVLIDPDTGTTEGELLAALGVQVSKELVANEKYLVRVQGRGESPYNLATTRASSHPSVDAISRAGGRLGVVLLGSGRVKKTDKPPADMKVTFTLRAMATSWLDVNGNAALDRDSEKHEALEFAAAIEKSATAENPTPMRAVVVADADIAGDGLVGNPGNTYFLRDCVRWLAGEEETMGTVESEKDVPIVHKKDEDTIWFYGTSILIPLLILIGGLTFSLVSRNRR
jgi:hypothetical protein